MPPIRASNSARARRFPSGARSLRQAQPGKARPPRRTRLAPTRYFISGARLAESEGFEPTSVLPATVFKTV